MSELKKAPAASKNAPPPIPKKHADSRYVSVFADSTPDVDITFRVAFLRHPTDYYVCGVDDLSLCISNLGMLDPTEKHIMQVVPRINMGNAGNATAFNVNIGGNTDAFSFNLDQMPQTVLSVNEFMMSLARFGDKVSEIIENGLITTAGNYMFNYVQGLQANGKHLGFYINPDGRLVIQGSRLFWLAFTVRFPSKRYQSVFGASEEFLSINPDGSVYKNPVIITTTAADPPVLQWEIKEFPVLLGQTFQSAAYAAAFVAQYNGGAVVANSDLEARINNYDSNVLGNCLFSSLDRRVSLELSCSLPITNSPMIDHNKETPDYVLGRWMFPRTNRTELTCGSSYVGISPEIKMVQSDHAGVIQLQGPKDRILYHSLKPQDNIQTVRLKLWARVRKYDEATDEWSMQTLVMPTEKTDWWHARLHFKSRD